MLKIAGKILIWLMLAAWFLLITGMVDNRAGEILCNRVEVHFRDTVNLRFVTPAEIRKLVLNSGQQIQGYPLDQINTRLLEERIEENPFIANAEVSKDISGRLEVRVRQREPLVRIIPSGSRGFYLDTRGEKLPLSDKFTPRILPVSGHIPLEGEQGRKWQEDLFSLSKFLVSDPFWKDQVVQGYVDRRGELELVPRVGAHQILLGDPGNWERKLRNLELLYEQGLSAYGGWNNYRTINLKYTNQVICTKR